MSTIVLTQIALFGALLAHPFHLSVCKIDYNAKARSLEVSVKIFTDDLEEALRYDGSPKLMLGTESEHPDAQPRLLRYLKANLSLAVDRSPVQYIFVGHETESLATWCYLEIMNVDDPKRIEVSNTILTELFEDQSNMVFIRLDKERKQRLMLSLRTSHGVAQF